MTAGEQTITIDDALNEVGDRLQSALDDLFPPLSNVALAHVRDMQPYLRAAIVLTAADALLADTKSPAIQETDAFAGSPSLTVSLHEQALILGSALEMLAVALSIHRLLLLPTSGDSLDRALVGSTILTGDYCFSRAAGMAAQTESPQVVDIFSRALQQVSEASLRRLFGGMSEAYEEDLLLASAGVEAICILARADEETVRASMSLAAALATRQWQVVGQEISQRGLSATGHAASSRIWLDLVDWAQRSLRQ